MLYCYKPLDIFWSDQGDLEFTAFHVTPYLNQILKKGEILPTIHTGKSTLGENEGLSHSIRGCLVSFFDEFQLAMNGCYSLALYAMLKKNLLSSEQFAKLIKDEWVNVYGGEHEFDIENGLNLMTFTQITTALYNAKDINTVFVFLNKSLDFQNPHILTEQWVDELPNTVEGVLENIGVLEVKFSKKYIADPSVYMGFAPSIYSEFVHSKGDFGQSTDEITEKVQNYFDFADADMEDHYYGLRSNDIAKTIVQKCDKKQIQFSSNFASLLRDLQEISIIDYDDDLDDLEVDESKGTINVDNEITFATKVKIPRDNIAIWNAAENEWRIPAYEGISVNESNVVALAGDIHTAMGGPKLIYQKGTTVRGRKNPQKQPIYVNNLGIHINSPITLYHASVNAENLLKFGYLTKEELFETYKREAVMGLGGGSGLSMTGDPRYAIAIAAYFSMTFRLAIRDITPLEVMEQFALAAPKTVSQWKSKKFEYLTDFDLSMSLLELAEQGKWCIRCDLGDLDYSTMGDPRLVDSDNIFQKTYIVDLDQCTDYKGNPNPYQDVEFIIGLINNLTIFASSNEELTYFAPFNSNLYKAFVGKDFSELNNLCIVTSKLKPGTIVFPQGKSDFYSIFDYDARFGTFFVSNLSGFELVGSSYRPFEEPYKIIKSTLSYPQPPKVKPEVNLNFEFDTDSVEYLTPDLKKKMVGFLPAEDEFRLHHPKEGLTPPKEFACADEIFEHLEQVWGTSEIDCFYPWFEIKTLEQNLSED